MKTFACQVERHKDEEVTGVCLGFCENNYWVCSRCLIEKHNTHQEKYKTFPQIIKQIQGCCTLLNKLLEEQQKNYFAMIAKFEAIQKQITSKLEYFKECIELLNNQQYTHISIYQLIASWKTKEKLKENDRIQKSNSSCKNHKFNKIAQDLSKIADNLFEVQNFKQAERYFKFVLGLDQTDFKAQFSLGSNSIYQLGMCLLKQNKNKKAVDCFNRAISLNKNNNASFLWKGIALRNQGHYDAAQEQFQFALNDERKQFKQEIMTQIGITLSKQKKEQEALNIFNEIQKQSPEYQECYLAKIKHLIKIGQFQEAFDCCNTLLNREKEKSDKLVYFYRGKVLMKQQRNQEAENDFETVINSEAIKFIPKLQQDQVSQSEVKIQQKQ